MKLIAKRPVLYLGRMYPEGAALPANNPAMVAAWLRAGSAKDVSNLNTMPPMEDVSSLDTSDDMEPTAEELAASSDYPKVEDADMVSNLDTAKEQQPGAEEPDKSEDTAAASNLDAPVAETREKLMEHTKDELEAMVQERGLTAPRGATKALLVELLLQPPAEEDED